MLILSLIILILAIALFPETIRFISYTKLTTLVLLYAGALSINALYIHSIGSGIGIYSGYFQITILSQYLDIFLFLLATIALIPWPLKVISISIYTIRIQNTPQILEYTLFILFTVIGGSLLVSSSDIISMYLSIELQSFAVYIFSTLFREHESGTAAALKYYLLGGLSSSFILLGSVLIYAYSGLTHFDDIYSFISVTSTIGDYVLLHANENLNHIDLTLTLNSFSVNMGIMLGTIILICGYLFKISAAPFHNWAPDVYDGTPTIITTWLTVFPKLTILFFLLEFISGISLNVAPIFWSLFYPYSLEWIQWSQNLGIENVSSWLIIQNLLLLSSLLSLILGTVVGLAQFKLKRLLAYSTISHVGFLLLALALNTESSIQSFIFYLIQYSITNINLFLIILALGYVTAYNKVNVHRTIVQSSQVWNTDILYIENLKGLFTSQPLLSLSFAICLFSMAGIPPLVGFFAKQQVLFAATYSGYYFLALVAIIVSVISASYYLMIIKVLHFSESQPEKDSILENKEMYILSPLHSFVIATLTLFILLFIVKPSFILNSTQLLAFSLYFW